MTRIKWSPAVVIATIRDRHAKGKKIISSIVQKECSSLNRYGYRYFKSWPAAVAASGLDYEQILKQEGSRGSNQSHDRAVQNIFASSDIVIAKIRERREKGQGLIAGVVNKEDRLLYRSATHHFKTWPKATRAAGFEYPEIFSAEWKRTVRRRSGYLRRRDLSLDGPAYRDSKTSKHDLIGATDPEFEKFEVRDVLKSLLQKRTLATVVANLLKRLLTGEDLEDAEYEQLAAAIREQPELMKILEKAEVALS